MPNELNIALSTGLTVTAQRYQNGAAVGSAISLSEVGSSGFYSGNMTGTAGTYQLAFLAAGANVGAGSIIWDGTNEIATSTLTQAGVQSALTAQGLTTARAGNLDNLDATVSSRLAPSGTLARVTLTDTATTLTNAPSVPSAAQIASQVRTELATELARVDVATSTRLAASAYTDPTAAPTAASVASAVWGAATKEITGGTVTTLTNAPSVPSAAAIASQVRTELSVELSKLDAAVSTRATPANIPAADISAIKAKTDNLPAAPAAVSNIPTAVQIRQEIDANSTKLDVAVSTRATPANIPTADVTAIKAKTDAINVDRINNTATLSQVGNLLAQANS